MGCGRLGRPKWACCNLARNRIRQRRGGRREGLNDAEVHRNEWHIKVVSQAPCKEGLSRGEGSNERIVFERMMRHFFLLYWLGCD
jgi:hypothetical protein